MTTPRLTGAEIVNIAGVDGVVYNKLAALVDAVAKHVDENGPLSDEAIAYAYAALTEEAKR